MRIRALGCGGMVAVSPKLGRIGKSDEEVNVGGPIMWQESGMPDTGIPIRETVMVWTVRSVEG